MSKKHKTAAKVGVGLGIGALAAAAAGAYYLYGTKEGAKQRRKIKIWGLKAKAEVMEQLEKMEDVSEAQYRQVIETVAKRYKALKNIDPEEVEEMVKDLKKHWKNIKKHIDAAKIVKKAKAKVKKSAAKKKKIKK
jgi:predicted RND superfamily exporter protein